LRHTEDRGFSDALLSMRGVAALSVLLSHAALIFPFDQISLRAGGWTSVRTAIVYLIVGTPWVTFFFVHSGFVLTISLDRSLSRQGIASFYLRRLFRLWPMIIFSCLVSEAYMAAGLAPAIDPVFTGWFHAILNPDTGHLDFWANLVLAASGLNWFFWSLQIEGLGSAVLPAFVILCRKRLLACVIGIALFFAVTAMYPASLEADAKLLCFVTGAALAYLHPEMSRLVGWIGPQKVLVIALTVLLFDRRVTDNHSLSFAIEAAAAAVIVFTLYYHQGALQRLLRRPAIRFVGEISFSLYVNSLISVHIAGLLLKPFADPQHQNVGVTLASMALSLLICLIVSTVTYHLIERPGMRAGKRISALLTGLAATRLARS
jgi:peptidoglycan/LPS O-acetylase OafA/YrhL